jgi:hypothetical protein
MEKSKISPPRYMMATTAIHRMGDLSSESPMLCRVNSEDDQNYFGSWVEGFGFSDIKFPKATTRNPTPEEREKYNGWVVGVNDTPHYRISIPDT